MKCWNPNLFLKEGNEKGYSEDYLKTLICHGRKIQSRNIPVVYSLSHLAKLSKTLYSDLHSFVSRATFAKPYYPYKNFPIKKRSGGKRWISIPAPPLMAVQIWISQNILIKIPPHNAAHAYVKNLKNPLKRHTEIHCNAKWILKLDIKNFFSNISERQVYRIFKELNYPNLLSFEMARICTRITPHRGGDRWNTGWNEHGISNYFNVKIGSLPQGAPTSPALSNLVCIDMDEEISKISMENNASFSRYADDLCFSFTDGTRNDVFKFKKKISSILWKYGFTENKKKTRIIPPGARKIVTGIVLNSDRPTIPKEIRDRIRMHLYYAKKLGIPSHCENKGFRSVIGFRNHLYGLIMYVYSIEPIKGEKFKDQFDKLPWIKYNI
nr:reverse transcriptase family protein [uncultured Desulfobacter sp.]